MKKKTKRHVAYLGLPPELLDLAEELLEPVQERLFLRLLRECCWKPAVRATRRAGLIMLDAGETLFGTRKFAERHGVTRNEVRRTRDRLVGLRWVSIRPARGDPLPAPLRAPLPGPIPSVVRVEKWREILWPSCEAGPIAGPLPGPLPGPVLPENKKPGSEGGAPPPAASSPVTWLRPNGGYRPRPPWAMPEPPPDAADPRQVELELRPPGVANIRRWIEERRRGLAEKPPAAGEGEPAGGQP